MTQSQRMIANRFAALLSGLVGGGIAGAVAWFALNAVVQINGQGWLARWNWPIPGWTIFVGVGSFVGGVVRAFATERARVRAEQLSALGQRSGFAYSPTVTKAELHLDSPWFPDWHRGEHWLRWTNGESLIDMVDLTEVTRGSKSHTTTKRTVFLSAVSGVPELDLRPRHFGHQLFRVLGFGEMSFDARKANTAQQTRAVKCFEQHWHLSVDDFSTFGKGSRSVSECEDAVRRLFTPTFMELLERFRGWSVRIRGDRLALWRGRGFAPTDRRESMIQSAAAFCDLFIARASLSPKDDQVIPPLPGDSAYVRTQRTIAVFGGGVVGLFLGFFGGFGFFASLESGLDRPFAMSAAIFFALQMVGAALGCAAGVLLGRSLSGFVKIPRSTEDPRDAAISESQPASGWTIVGLFGGFIAGALTSAGLMAAVDHILGLNNVPFWLLAPIFFAFPIVGLLVGAFAGGRFGSRR
jgi:hypothetical protein